MTATFTINGVTRSIVFDSGSTLLEVLRENGHLDVKHGCGQGECGTCLVLLDGKPVNSCQVFAATVDGMSIITSSGIGSKIEPSAIHEAFADTGAVQCGFCTPGMVISTAALIERNDNPSDKQIAEALSGNLCRCTGYAKTIEAVREAARRIREEDSDAGNGGRSNAKGKRTKGSNPDA